MKPTPDRLRLDSYPLRRDIPTRYADMDMVRHLNNVSIGQFYEEARFRLFDGWREEMTGRQTGQVMLVNVDIAYLREGRYPGVVTVGTGILRRSLKSFVLGQALFMNGVCFSAADAVHVYAANGVAGPLPAEFGDLFEPLRLPSFVDGR